MHLRLLTNMTCFARLSSRNFANANVGVPGTRQRLYTCRRQARLNRKHRNDLMKHSPNICFVSMCAVLISYQRVGCFNTYIKHMQLTPH